MKNKTLLALLASLALAACSNSEDTAAPEPDSKQSWAEFTATSIDEYYRRNPGVGG